MKFPRRYRKWVFVLILLIILFGVAAGLKGSKYREKLLQQPVLRHFTHTYFSLRKISDIFFIPYLFAKSDIPTYYIRVNQDNIVRMNQILSEDSFSGILNDENKLFVTAEFITPDYEDRVKIRYRGRGAVHWNSLKKSLRIKFPDENYFNGNHLMNFIIPYDRLYYVEPLNMYRAKKLGLINLEMYFSRLNINGADTGVYLTFEHWSPEFLAKKALPESPLYGRVDETSPAKYIKEQYQDFLDKEELGVNEEIEALFELLLKTDDYTFSRLIPQVFDLDKFYGWNIVNILAGSNHQDEVNNTILYFNNATGKFEIIPWDIHIGEVGLYDDTFSLLTRRILSNKKFLEERNIRLSEFLKDDKELDDDLEFYDNLFNETKKEFFKDTSKIHTNFKFLSTVKDNRDLIIANWEEAKKLLDNLPDYSYKPENTNPDFKTSFKNLLDLRDTRAQFLAKNKAFYPIGEDSIGLSGVVVINDDTLIPPGVNLVITAGTNIFMGDGVSMVVNGAVNILGTRENPVNISRANSRKPWGSLLVLNAEDKSRVSFLNANGGSGDKINGVLTTGMIAFHNSDVDITNSTFISALDDDALNIKMAKGNVRWSYFSRNSSDAIDLDMLDNDSEIKENVFIDNDGDAIDISFSDISILENDVDTCGDKGISIGEMSSPYVLENSISNCLIGIAVKDLSDATLESNVLKENDIAISLYNKKPEFDGAHATLIKNIFSDNVTNIKNGELSSYERYTDE